MTTDDLIRKIDSVFASVNFDWRTRDNPIFDFLHSLDLKSRKYRLLNTAIARHPEVFLQIKDEYSIESITVGEQYADEHTSVEFIRELKRIYINNSPSIAGSNIYCSAIARRSTDEDITSNLGHSINYLSNDNSRIKEPKKLLLDILIRSLETEHQLKPEHRTSDTVGLARQMYNYRDFSAMPILADALQDAGCDNEHVLSQLRNTELHWFRGCYVLDFLLNKL